MNHSDGNNANINVLIKLKGHIEDLLMHPPPCPLEKRKTDNHFHSLYFSCQCSWCSNYMLSRSLAYIADILVYKVILTEVICDKFLVQEISSMYMGGKPAIFELQIP